MARPSDLRRPRPDRQSSDARRRSTVVPTMRDAPRVLRRDVRRQPVPASGRRHGSVHGDDRVALEQDGWRTTLDYRENHRRGGDGVLHDVDVCWRGEAERTGADGGVIVYSVVGPSPASVWRRLRIEAEATRLGGRREDRATP